MTIASAASFTRACSNQEIASASCSTLGPPDAVETYSGGSGLQYQGDGNWQFNWATPKAYAGSCRVLRVNLADGEINHTAQFQFK